MANTADQSSLSESELSNLNDTPPIKPLPSDHANGFQDSEQDAIHDMETSMSEQDDDAVGSEDAEYDTETPPLVGADQKQRANSSSDESLRPGKRKAGVDDDEHMKQNPELYGLRRSGRARPSQRVINSSSEDNDSGSDINIGRRRKRLKTAAVTNTSPRLTPAVGGSDESQSDSDTYGGAKGRSFAKKHRKLQAVTSGRATPSQGEVRFSTRRAAKVSTYNEDDDHMFSEEEDSEMVTPAYNEGADEEVAAIDIVLNHRRKEGNDTEDPQKQDFEYFIKWQGQAHYHATWVSWAGLSASRGVRRVENYFKKVVKTELDLSRDPDIAPEEKEKWNLDRETYLDALNDYMKVERVIGSRDGDAGVEYLVKWKSLFYDSCTWESASLISELAQTEIDRYLDRSSKLPVSNKTESNPATRREYKPFRTQPSYIKFGQLREFQIHGVNFLGYHWCKGNNVILADEMGLGKTVQTVSFMDWLRHDRGQHGPFIVVVPLSTMPAWADTFNNWTPDINYVVYNGNEAARKVIREHELLVDGNVKKVKFNVLLTTYEYILADSTFLSQLKWQFMAVDEAHRLKNRESQLYAKLMDFGAPSRLLITGTPMQNTLGELSALMDFLMPGKVHVEENIDLASEGASKKIAELTDAISPYMIRRTKQKVENDLPPKTEKIVRVELSDVQLDYYKHILTRNYAALNQGAKGPKQSLLNIMMELKKASNHPFMFPNAEEKILAGSNSREDQLKALITSSGKMMLLDRLLTKLKKDNHRVLIFSQMVKMLDILGDYLHLRGHQFQRLDGTIAAGPRRMAIDHFNAPDSSDFCFLLSTRAGGLGINLMTADTVVLFDSDWNPQADLQAMARAHRIGQKNPVTIYRLVSKDTVEEEVLERARNKLMLEFITIQRGVTDKDARELSDRMARVGASVAEPTSSDDISRILKRRGQKMFEQSGNQKKLEELDIDAVLENAEEHRTEQPEGMTTDGGEEFLKSFEYTDVKIDLEWDDIIPKDQLEKIKQEEKKKEDEKYLEAVIEQNQPRKRKGPEIEGREQRAAKKRARDLAAEAAAEVESEDISDTEADPKRPLSEKEVRNLIRAHEKFGSIEARQEEMIKDARLVGRDVELLKATLQEVIDISNKLLNEEQERVLALERASQRPVTKKDRKAVLFDYHGVKRINAETITERPIEMRMVKEVTEAVPDFRNFRVPEASKPAHYTCDWGAREDGMLCVGIARHGYGAWVAIRDDLDLGMTDKFYLEEHRVDKKEERTKADDKNAKSPGAVHLVRRANYLLSVLKDKTSNGTNLAAKRALENHHRNNKKHLGRHERNESISASPAPGLIRKGPTHSGHTRHQQNPHDRRVTNHEGLPKLHRYPNYYTDDRTKHRPSEERKHHHSHSHNHGHSHGHGSSPLARNGDLKTSSSPSDGMAKMFAVMKPNLVRVSGATKAQVPDDDKRLKIIKVEIINIGNFIKAHVRDGKELSADLEERLWNYVSEAYWPQAKKVEKRVSGLKLKMMYEKLISKESSAGSVGSAGSHPKHAANGEGPSHRSITNGSVATTKVA
ncbi:ATP-dependent DNA helicase Hrp3 [Elasticomyces elasticus]|nr:ATP-dependent DNA helicase Hrp3 [Elasticomyces elasticus]